MLGNIQRLFLGITTRTAPLHHQWQRQAKQVRAPPPKLWNVLDWSSQSSWHAGDGMIQWTRASVGVLPKIMGSFRGKHHFNWTSGRTQSLRKWLLGPYAPGSRAHFDAIHNLAAILMLCQPARVRALLWLVPSRPTEINIYLEDQSSSLLAADGNVEERSWVGHRAQTSDGSF